MTPSEAFQAKEDVVHNVGHIAALAECRDGRSCRIMADSTADEVSMLRLGQIVKVCRYNERWWQALPFELLLSCLSTAAVTLDKQSAPLLASPLEVLFKCSQPVARSWISA